MKCMLMSAVLLCGLVGVSALPAGAQKTPKPIKIDSTYDKFKDQTTVIARLGSAMPADKKNLRALRNPTSLALMANYAGESKKAPDEVVLVTMEYCDGVDPYDKSAFIILVDAERRQITPKDRGRGDPYVATIIPMTLDQLAGLAKAQSVEAQLGLLEFKFTPAQLDGIKQFVEYFK